jgi:photosystem II stability/assembly factor-like uncharacterized protein
MNRSMPAHCSVVLLVLLSGLCTSVLEAQTRPSAADGSSYDPAWFTEMRYRMIGPSRGGRVTTVTGIAEQPHTFYMGSTGGGVWKTINAGQTWSNVSDGYFATASMGALQVADSDPNIIYAGTGSDGIRSNLITGRGVYKSTDGAQSWSFVGLRDVGQIGAVEIHPSDPNLVYVAAIGHAFGRNKERGVYRTRDGGANWEKVLFVADSIGAVDLELNPADPREIYAAMWRGERKPWTVISGARAESGVGIYKSTDAGNTWRKVTNGLPGGLVGKIDLAVSPADPNRIYALVEAPDPEEGVYRSDDRGETWRLTSNQRGLMNRPFYYTNIDADPTNADIVYVNNESFFKSSDGGSTFERLPTPHGDNHDMWINPQNPNVFIQANDGGVNVTLDGGKTWSTQLNQPTAELYQVAVDDRFPYYVYAGQQDNTTIGVPSLPPTSWLPDAPLADWIQIGGCETGPAVPKPGDPTVVYSNCKGRFGRYSHVTGQEKQFYVGAANIYGHNPADLQYRFQRVSPIHVSPHDASVVYHASQYLHRSTDEGQTWETISPDLTANRPEHQVISGSPITRDITGEEIFSALYAVEESPLERGVIWTGSNDGLVHVTRDNGKTWANVTPKGLPANARIQTVDASPHQPGEAYIAAYRYLLDDWQPYIFRTTNYGKSWTRLTTGKNGIPADYPTRVVREDPARDGLLYAGTEFGMFVSFNEGAQWQPFQQNLPVTPITDIAVHQNDLVLSTMGRSFWILDNLTPLHQLSREVAASRLHLFAPDGAYRMRYSTYPDDPAAPEYPPVGAVIDYWLAEPAGTLTLEILDESGKLIRSYSSDAPGETAVAVQGMRAPGMERMGTAKLPNDRGMHRFLWDLSYAGPWHADKRRSGRGGPMVVPGNYQVRLSTEQWSETRPLEVRIDPRVAADGVIQADLEAQLALNLEIRDLLTQSRLAAARIADVLKQTDSDAAAKPAALRMIEAQLVTSTEGSYPQPMLTDQIAYLYNMTTGADQRPGRDAFERYTVLRTELEQRIAELQTLLGPATASSVGGEH